MGIKYGGIARVVDGTVWWDSTVVDWNKLWE